MSWPNSDAGYQRYDGPEECCVPGGKVNSEIASIVGEANMLMARLEAIAIKDRSFNYVAGAYEELAKHRCEVLSTLLTIASPDECPKTCVETVQIAGFKSVRVDCDSET